MLETIILELKANSVPEENIIMINLDKRPYKGIKTTEALHNGYYQAQIDHATKRMVGAEALVRWFDSERLCKLCLCNIMNVTIER